jgi:hypothetical protein
LAKRCPQRVGAAGFRGGQIGLFARIAAEIVEFHRAVFEKLDQLPIALADRAGRSAVMVVGQVPVQRVWAVQRSGGIAQQRR